MTLISGLPETSKDFIVRVVLRARAAFILRVITLSYTIIKEAGL